VSDLPRKSVEAIADAAAVPARTLQDFLAIAATASASYTGWASPSSPADHASRPATNPRCRISPDYSPLN